MLVLAVLYWLEADTIPISPLDGEVNAAAMPKMLAVALAFLSVLLGIQAMVQFVRARNEGHGQAANASSASAKDKAAGWREHARALGLIALGSAFIALLPVLGYLISVALLIASVALYMGQRKSWQLLAVTLGVALCFQLLFVQVLHIQLPSGLLAHLSF